MEDLAAKVDVAAQVDVAVAAGAMVGVEEAADREVTQRPSKKKQSKALINNSQPTAEAGRLNAKQPLHKTANSSGKLKMNLHIHNYEILNFPSDNLVISEKGVSKITSMPLIEALNTIKSRNNRSISKTELSEIFRRYKLNPDSALSFLEKILVIKKSVADSYFEKTIILHDWGIEFEEISIKELLPPIETYQLFKKSPKLKKNTKYFIFILCKSYDYHNLKNLYFDIAHRNPESATSIGFITGDTFTISPPYISEIGNPCHYCHMDRLGQNDKNNQKNNSWPRLLKFCKSQDKPIPVSEPTLLQKAFIFGSTIEHIKLYTKQGTAQRHQDSLFQSSYINLNNGVLTEDSISHWHMCDCLRPAS